VCGRAERLVKAAFPLSQYLPPAYCCSAGCVAEQGRVPYQAEGARASLISLAASWTPCSATARAGHRRSVSVGKRGRVTFYRGKLGTKQEGGPEPWWIRVVGASLPHPRGERQTRGTTQCVGHPLVWYQPLDSAVQRMDRIFSLFESRGAMGRR
jgi:hypothetical protein